MKSKIFLLIGLILLISALPLYSNTVSEKEFEEVEIYKIEFFGNKIIKDDRLKNLISTNITVVLKRQNIFFVVSIFR